MLLYGCESRKCRAASFQHNVSEKGRWCGEDELSQLWQHLCIIILQCHMFKPIYVHVRQCS